MSHFPTDDDLDLDSHLREAVLEVLAEPTPVNFVARVVQRASHLQKSAPQNGGWRARRVLLATALATAGLLAIAPFIGRQDRAWAQVINAMSNRPWLHAKGTSDNENAIVEFWFSARDGIIVQRQGEQVCFFDLRQQIWDSYKLAENDENALYRLPLLPQNRVGIDGVRNIFAAMLVGDLRNTFTDGGQQSVEYIHQDVPASDQSVEEFGIKIRSPGGPLVESVFRVDPATRLPKWWKYELPADANGVKRGFQCDIDYPDVGPKTIYGAGVPKDAPLVDRIPKGDERLLSGAALARKRVDPHYAVVVSSLNSDPRHPRALACYRIWRNGNKWRVDFCRSPQNGKSLPQGADPAEWWKQHVEQVRSFPESIADGTRECRFDPVLTNPPRPDPRDPGWFEIASFNRSYQPLMNADDPAPNENLPEVNARHPINLGVPGDKITVDWTPQDGPPGSVRVEVIRAKPYPGEPSGYRYWIDPQKDYLIMQHAVLKLTANGQLEQQGPVPEVIEVCTSPSGRMYPTLVRIHNGSVSIGTGDKSDVYQRFYYDFTASIRDDLFDTSK